MNEYEVGNHLEHAGYFGIPDPDPEAPNFANHEEWRDEEDEQPFQAQGVRSGGTF